MSKYQKLESHTRVLGVRHCGLHSWMLLYQNWRLCLHFTMYHHPCLVYWYIRYCDHMGAIKYGTCETSKWDLATLVLLNSNLDKHLRYKLSLWCRLDQGSGIFFFFFKYNLNHNLNTHDIKNITKYINRKCVGHECGHKMVNIHSVSWIVKRNLWRFQTYHCCTLVLWAGGLFRIPPEAGTEMEYERSHA